MKKIYFTILTIIFAMTFCFSQDLITKKSDEGIQAKILEIGLTEIRYKKFDNLDGPTYVILKSDIAVIKHRNGTKEIFNEETKTVDGSTSSLSTGDLFLKGNTDASRYYKGYKGAATGTLILSLLSPVVGLIPAIACSSTKPSQRNYNHFDPDLMKKTDYYNGVTQRAKKIKQGQVWSNWGIAFGINVFAVLILASRR